MKFLLGFIRQRRATLTVGADSLSIEPFLAKLAWVNPGGESQLEAGRGESPEAALEALEARLIDRVR